MGVDERRRHQTIRRVDLPTSLGLNLVADLDDHAPVTRDVHAFCSVLKIGSPDNEVKHRSLHSLVDSLCEASHRVRPVT